MARSSGRNPDPARRLREGSAERGLPLQPRGPGARQEGELRCYPLPRLDDLSRRHHGQARQRQTARGACTRHRSRPQRRAHEPRGLPHRVGGDDRGRQGRVRQPLHQESRHARVQNSGEQNFRSAQRRVPPRGGPHLPQRGPRQQSQAGPLHGTRNLSEGAGLLRGGRASRAQRHARRALRCRRLR